MDALHKELIRQVCKYPGMYTRGGTLENLYDFLAGYDIATGCLTGFKEWLVPRFQRGNNLHWRGLIDQLLEEESCPQDQRVARLGQLIDEFDQFTSEDRGLIRVYVRYHAWLLTQCWYRPGDLGYIPPPDGVNKKSIADDDRT